MHMKTKISNRTMLILGLIIGVIGADQITKFLIRRSVEYHENIEIFGKYLIMTKVENSGAFLGMGDSMPKSLYIIFMILLPLAAVGYGIYYLLKNKTLSNALMIGLSLIIGGGLGNIYDRILNGSVTDFLFFDFVIFHTGIVNVADIAVTAGFFLVLYDQLLTNYKKPKV